MEAFRTRWATHNFRFHNTQIKHFHHPLSAPFVLSFDGRGLLSQPQRSAAGAVAAAAGGQLAELRAADLRFTAEEAAALLRKVVADPETALPDPAVAALAARTEGWAAGLQLAALSLRGQNDVAGFVAAFTGSNRYVLDFLAEEVLEQQSEQVRSFLLETSVLERLAARCVTRSPATPAARRCWSRWSWRACSWCRWMRCAAGGAITTCSPTCSAPTARKPARPRGAAAP